MNLFVAFLFLFTVSEILCQFEPATEEKDLYSILGLKDESASLQEIKRAYRKLALQYHPDKAVDRSDEAHEIFREIAEAYEILSDSERRRAYDQLRKFKKNNGNDKFHPRTPDRGDYSRDQFEPDYFEDVFDSMGFNDQPKFVPSLIGSILTAGQVIFPFMVMVSSDKSHFAFLNYDCSFGVYKGDIAVLMQLVTIMNNIPGSNTDSIAEAVFKTPSFPSLKGACFAGLDPAGIFSVFDGPDPSYTHGPLWSSSSIDDGESFYILNAYYLELSDNGEVAVRTAGRRGENGGCVWSTKSCDPFMAKIRDFASNTSLELDKLFPGLKHLLPIFKSSVKKLIDILNELWTRGKTLFRNIKIGT